MGPSADQLDSRAEAHVDLAEVLLSGGRDNDAACELNEDVPSSVELRWRLG
jgi:hypothetical protein